MSNPINLLYRALPRVNRIDGSIERCLVVDHADLIAEVLKSAEEVWKSHRPVSFNELQHINNPDINARNDQEKNLFRALVELKLALAEGKND